MNKTSVILGGAAAVLIVFLGVAGYVLIKNPAGSDGDKATKNQDQEQGQAIEQGQMEMVQDNTREEWRIYTAAGKEFSFKYQVNFGANVWSPAQWPPLAVLVGAGQDPVAAGCGDIHDDTGNIPAGVAGKTDAGTAYTIYAGSDAGAGQLYSSYCYVFERASGGAAVINFVIRSHTACGFGGCGAYCGTQYETECANLDRKTAIEEPIARMAVTFVFNVAEAAAVPESSVPTYNYSGKIVTLANDQTNIALEAGETFLLKLGQDYNWNAAAVDNTIVVRENAVAATGAPGLFRALRFGDTDVIATGEPVCRNSVPPCAMPAAVFTVHAAVR